MRGGHVARRNAAALPAFHEVFWVGDGLLDRRQKGVARLVRHFRRMVHALPVHNGGALLQLSFRRAVELALAQIGDRQKGPLHQVDAGARVRRRSERKGVALVDVAPTDAAVFAGPARRDEIYVDLARGELNGLSHHAVGRVKVFEHVVHGRVVLHQILGQTARIAANAGHTIKFFGHLFNGNIFFSYTVTWPSRAL